MGWSLGFDSDWQRDIGYGVPAHCDHPGCRRVIDRGLSYVCGGQPYGGDDGCGLYFCEKHLCYDVSANDKFPVQLCERCQKRKKPFKPTPDHPRWTKFKMTDPSWAEWRESLAGDAQPGDDKQGGAE